MDWGPAEDAAEEARSLELDEGPDPDDLEDW